MKIAFFTDTFLPNRDGVVTSLLSLVKGLADKGHKIYIIAPRVRGTAEFRYQNIIVKRVPATNAFYYEGYNVTWIFNKKILNYLKKEKVDIIHIQTPLSLGLQGVRKSKILKVPLVGTFHTLVADPQYLKHFELNYPIFEKIIWSCLKNMYYNKCDLVTCPSQAIKKELISKGFNKPIIVISNGIDPSIFDNSKWKEVKNNYNKNGKLLLFVGRLAYEKNIPYLLDCFKLVLKKIPNTKLIVIGDGPQREDIKNKIISLGIEKNVILTGKINHDDLVKSSIFKVCDLFVTASTTETQGITLLEAQANGLVCIGADARGLKELIKNGHNGYLVKNKRKEEFAKKVIKLLSDKKLIKKMQKNTLKEIKKHYMANVIGVWEEEYSKLIEQNKFRKSTTSPHQKLFSF